jgi:hypothetical protein
MSQEDPTIVVTPIDNAGNFGESMNSSKIIVDHQAPSILLSSPSSGSWFNNDFVINQSESDLT